MKRPAVSLAMVSWVPVKVIVSPSSAVLKPMTVPGVFSAADNALRSEASSETPVMVGTFTDPIVGGPVISKPL